MAGRTSVDPWVASYENLALSVDELQADTSDDQKMAQARVRAMTRQNIQRAAESVRQLQQQLDDAVLAGRITERELGRRRYQLANISRQIASVRKMLLGRVANAERDALFTGSAEQGSNQQQLAAAATGSDRAGMQAIRLAQQSAEVGRDTLGKLNAQSESIGGMKKDLDKTDAHLGKSEGHLRGMESWSGAVANWFTGFDPEVETGGPEAPPMNLKLNPPPGTVRCNYFNNGTKKYVWDAPSLTAQRNNLFSGRSPERSSGAAGGASAIAAGGGSTSGLSGGVGPIMDERQILEERMRQQEADLRILNSLVTEIKGQGTEIGKVVTAHNQSLDGVYNHTDNVQHRVDGVSKRTEAL